MLTTIKKTYSSILFVSKEGTRRQQLGIVLHNSSLNSDIINYINVCNDPGTIYDPEPDILQQPEYPISFKLPSSNTSTIQLSPTIPRSVQQ